MPPERAANLSNKVLSPKGARQVRSWSFNRYAFTICIAALLAGCGGSQPFVAASGAMTQSRVTATHSQRGGSWMLPEAKSEDLLYVTGAGKSYVLSYPGGKLVGTISGGAAGACSDSSGNVFLAGDAGIVEYAHGSTVPIATLSIPGSIQTDGCGVDPTTGNLAVTFESLSIAENVAVFQDAQGTPATYYTDFPTYFCGYDDQGNLFVDGWNGNLAISELPKGSGGVTEITLSPTLTDFPGQVQWDGTYLSIEGREHRRGATLYRLTVSGSTGSVIAKTQLRPADKDMGQSWIRDGQIFIPFGLRDARNVGVWRYPQGGKPKITFPDIPESHSTLFGVTFSAGSKNH